MRRDNYDLRWEDAAVKVKNVEGWVCTRCRKFWGDGDAGERAARYCCSTSAPCKCGSRRDKFHTVCQECHAKQATERYFAMPEVEWDGTTPLVEFDNDRYLFDVEALAEFLLEADFDYLSTMDNPWANCEEPSDEQLMAFALEQLRFCLCREVKPPRFDLAEFLFDYDEDLEHDAAGVAVENAVNEWIGQQRKMYAQDGKRPSVESLKRHLGI